ncbi:hypothetical protein D3C84_718700 [compost metagenome]
MNGQPLVVWTVFDNPDDYPGVFVARKWLVYAGVYGPTHDVLTGPTLQSVRDQIPAGLYCSPRSPEDDPVIVESWF